MAHCQNLAAVLLDPADVSRSSMAKCIVGGKEEPAVAAV